MNSLYAGIDVSAKSNVVFLMNADGSKHSSFTVINNKSGAQILSNSVCSAMKSGKFDNVILGLEATSIYGDNLVRFIREDYDLSKFKKKIHVLNAKQVKNFKEAYPELPKNDSVDAFIIADNLRFGRITSEVYMDDYRCKALQNLTRCRYFAAQNLVREKQRFLNYLFLKFSELAAPIKGKVFSDTFGATSLSVIQDFADIDEIAYMPLDKLIEFINEKGKNSFPEPEKTAKALQAAARGSYRLPTTINNTVNQVLSIEISSIRALETQIKAFDKAIAEQIKIIPNTLESIPGIGPVYSAGIIAEIGDVNRFEGQASVAKYAGLAWSEYQSGSFTAENTRLIKSCNRYLRYYLIEAADSVRKRSSEYKSFYSLKFHEVNKFQHKRALVLTARKLVRLVYSLLKTNRLYIPPEK